MNDGVIGNVFSLVYVSLKEFGVVGSDTYTYVFEGKDVSSDHSGKGPEHLKKTVK